MSGNLTKVSSLARSHTETAIKTLAGIMASEEAPPAARVAAANSLLDRGWGKAAQPIVGDEDNPLRMVTRVEYVVLDPLEPPPY